MSESKKTLGGALRSTRLDETAIRGGSAPEPLRLKRGPRNPNAIPSRRGKVGLTVYLDPVCHAALKRIALEDDIPIKELIEEGINLMLERRQSKPLA